MPREWSNWSGGLRFTPGRIATPESEDELCDLVRRAAAAGTTVRPVGAGHSTAPLVETGGVLVSMERFRGVAAHDAAACEASVRAGTRLHELGGQLFRLGMAMENLGDVDTQAIAGVVSTGTHGSGKRLGSLSSTVVGMRLVNGEGEVVEVDADRDPDGLRAAQVSLGALGVATAVRLRLLPAFRLRRREWCARTDDCLAHLDDLAERHRGMDFYWYPRRDDVKIRTLDPADDDPIDVSFARRVEERVGWSHEVVPQRRDLRFHEMEYALPAAAGPACFRAVRRRVMERHRATVGWRVLYRTIAADDALLSPFSGRDSVTISLHQNASLPYRDYFADVEPIFLACGGRPHWGKVHNLRAADLRPRYPEWDEFLAVRERMDPGGTFLNPYLRALLGVA